MRIATKDLSLRPFRVKFPLVRLVVVFLPYNHDMTALNVLTNECKLSSLSNSEPSKW